MKKNYQKLRLAFAGDPDMLRSLEMEEQSESLREQKDVMREFFMGQALSESQRAKLEFIQAFLRGTDGDTPTDEHLLELITPLIPPPIPGEPGKDFVPTEADLKKIASKVRIPIVEKVIEKTEVIKEQPIVTERLIEKDIDEEKLFTEFVKFLKKRKPLNSGDINGLQGFSKDGIKYKFEELMHGGGSGGSNVSITYSVDLSAQADGINKTFTVPANDAFILLTGTDSPFIYKPTTDYTGTGTTTLTMTAAVNAPSAGSTLILTYKAT